MTAPIAIPRRIQTLAAGLLLAAGGAAAGDAQPVRTDHLSSILIAESTGAVPGQSLRIGLRLQHDPHWHTYWRNPGDSGLPTRIELDLPAGVVAGDIEWPAPLRFDVADIVNFGYADTVVLPLTLALPDSLPGESIEIAAKASWLICETECIPGGADYRLRLPIVERAEADPRWRADFAAASARQPSPLAAEASYRVEDERVQIDLRGSELPRDIAAWEVFPAIPQVVANGAYPTWSRIDDGLRLSLPQSEYFAGTPPRFELLLVNGDRALAVAATAP